MRRTAFIAAFAVVFGLGTAGTAHAAPVLNLPDLNFAALDNGRNSSASTTLGGCPVLFNSQTFQMFVSTGFGDAMQINAGQGYTNLTNSFAFALNATGIGEGHSFRYGPGSLTVSLGGETGSVTIGMSEGLRLVASPVGLDGIGIVKVSGATSLSPWKNGQTIALDLHIFDIHTEVVNGVTMQCGSLKGDIAPTVPEPATVSLLGLSLLGLAARARRKLFVS